MDLNSNGQTFEQWYNEVNQYFLSQCGLTADDMADQCWYDWFEGDYSPADAYQEIMENEGYDGLLGF